jgi:hypothetical protein
MYENSQAEYIFLDSQYAEAGDLSARNVQIAICQSIVNTSEIWRSKKKAVIRILIWAF